MLARYVVGTPSEKVAYPLVAPPHRGNMALKGQAKKDYQRNYMRSLRLKGRVVRPALDPVRPGVKTPGKTNLKAKLAKAGLNIGKDGTLDLTQSTREPVRPESNTTVPMFNPSIHKAGDKVMVYQGKRLIETVIPELDADGHPVYDV